MYSSYKHIDIQAPNLLFSIWNHIHKGPTPISPSSPVCGAHGIGWGAVRIPYGYISILDTGLKTIGYIYIYILHIYTLRDYTYIYIYLEREMCSYTYLSFAFSTNIYIYMYIFFTYIYIYVYIKSINYIDAGTNYKFHNDIMNYINSS